MTRPLTMKHGTVATPPEERVPIHHISKLIQRWVEVYRADHSYPGQNDGTYEAGENKDGCLAVLGFHCNMSGRRLRLIKDGKFDVGTRKSGTFHYVDWVPFDIADKIVCASVGPLAWHQEPLNQYYGPLTVKPNERAYEHEQVAA